MSSRELREQALLGLLPLPATPSNARTTYACRVTLDTVAALRSSVAHRR